MCIYLKTLTGKEAPALEWSRSAKMSVSGLRYGVGLSSDYVVPIQHHAKIDGD